MAPCTESMFFTTIMWLLCVSRSVSGSGPLRYEIYEDLPVGSVVGNIRNDRSQRLSYSNETLAVLRYHFRSPNTYLKVDPVTGVLAIASPIDREQLCLFLDRCIINADIIIQPNQFYDIVAVVVTVLDVNDNAPVFPRNSVKLDIVETALTGTSFLLPAAEDRDGEEFGVKEYRMEPPVHQKFRLLVTKQADGSDQVRLQLLDSLDREQVSQYSIRIVAVDGGLPQKTATLDVRIVVVDANDNPPRLAMENYEATLVEDLPAGTTILRIEAEDPDEGPNGNLTYTLESYGDIFEIQDSGWIVLKGVVDYERDKNMILTVIVADQGTMSLTSYARVAIHVSDVNDNAPVITVTNLQGKQNAQIRENLPPDTFISLIVGSDADSGDNGRADCDVNSPRFRLIPIRDGSSEYKLSSAVRFDREENPFEELTISCRDRGTPAMSSSMTISVEILDENDNSPRIQDDKVTIQLRENNALSIQIAYINATDRDAGINAQLSFRVEPVPGFPADAVSVNERGVVTATTVFDYEERRVYAYLVIVSDGGIPSRSSTARLDIRVLDMNDERPTFEMDNYVFHTTENQPPGTLIEKVRAWDDDATADFKKIYYTLVDSTPYLSINQTTGEISNVKVIDRERDSVLKVKVRASNSPDPSVSDAMSSDVSVKIFVDDINDNSPVLIFPNSYNRTLLLPPWQDLRPGDRLGKVEASDADDGMNANLTFELDMDTEASKAFVDIDIHTGWLTISKRFAENAALDVREFQLVVKVTDQGNPRRSVKGVLDVVTRTEPEMPVESRSVHRFDGSHVIIVVGVGCGVLVIVVVIAVVVVCFRVQKCKIKNKHKYNCRLEADRATSTGSLNHSNETRKNDGQDGGSRSVREKGRKGVRFNLDQDEGISISPPITDAKLSCPYPDECAFHRHGSPLTIDSVLEAFPEPLYAFRMDDCLPAPSARMMMIPNSAARHHHHHHQYHHPQPIMMPILHQRNGTLRKVDIPTIDEKALKLQGFEQAGLVVRSPSCSMDNRSSVSAPVAVATSAPGTAAVVGRWSSGSLQDSGQGPSDEDDFVFYPAGSQEPFFPAESKV